MQGYTIIDATNLILGRMASVVAKRLLLGEKIIIINAEKAVVSGDRKHIINEYKRRLRIRTLTNPRKGPFHPRKPDRIVRRTIRGMLPWKKPRGRKAFHNLQVYIGVPDILKGKDFKAETIKEADYTRLKEKYIYVGEISAQISNFKMKS